MSQFDYVDPFLGAGGSWLGIVGEDLVPPVSWMGGKRRYAADLRALLGIHAGKPRSYLLGDASWWGWVWPILLDPVTGPEVSMLLRFWRGRDPRALWFWLREIGPLGRTVEGAAQLLWLQARAASGVPVWWEGSEVLAAPGAGRERQRAADRGANGLRSTSLVKWDGGMIDGVDVARQAHAMEPHLVQWASTQIDEAGQSRVHVGTRADGGVAGSGGIIDPGTIADRLDAIRRALVGSEVIIAEADARTLTERAASMLAPTAVVLDPPYQDKTGYPCACPRADVLHIAETWARHGHRVVLHEAVSLRADLGAGWTDARLSRPGAAKGEWVTCYGVDVRALLPGLLRGAA